MHNEHTLHGATSRPWGRVCGTSLALCCVLTVLALQAGLCCVLSTLPRQPGLQAPWCMEASFVLGPAHQAAVGSWEQGKGFPLRILLDGPISTYCPALFANAGLTLTHVARLGLYRGVPPCPSLPSSCHTSTYPAYLTLSWEFLLSKMLSL